VSPTTTPSRYEIKIPLESWRGDEAEAWVRLHPAQWRVAYPPRQVNNLYFDSQSLVSLNANLSGVADRAKLRLRWYGPDLQHVEGGNLELKIKEGAVGRKKIAPVSCALDLATGTWPALVERLREALDPPATAWLDAFALPVLINRYRRAYYVTPDGGVRLTVDSDLVAYDQRPSLRPNLDRPTPLESVVVVELKAGVDAAARLSTILEHSPVRAGRFSKYVQGLVGAW
jgi:hypothetical protein